MRNSVLMIFVLFGFTGCIPYHFTEKPGVLGKVVDSETNQPINDVDVKCKLQKDYIENGGVVVKTSQDGTFYLPPQKKWGLYFFPMDCFPLQYNLIFSHNEYSQIQLEFQHSAIDKLDTLDFETVKLDPKGS